MQPMRKKKPAKAKAKGRPQNSTPVVRAQRIAKKPAMAQMPRCPSFNGQSAMRFPVHYRSTITVVPGTSIISAFAPFNNTLGATYFQSVAPPNAGAIVTSVQFCTDPYLTSLLTPITTSGANNALSVRATRFCVEFLVTDALATVNQSILINKWRQPGMPHLNGLAPEFNTVWEALQEDVNTMEIPMAAALHTRCVNTAMQERSALDFTPVATTTAAWISVYGGTSSTTDVGNYRAPWYPIVMSVANTGSTAITLRVIVKAEFEIIAPPNNWVSRLHQPLPTGGPGAEEAWWKHQRGLHDSNIKSLHSGPMNRTSAGYVGVSA